MASPPRSEADRLAVFLTLATVVQVAFWTWATPGPALLAGAARGPGFAFGAVAATAATLGLGALAAAPLLGRPLAELGAGAGRDAARAALWVAAGAAVAAPVLWWAAGDPSLSAVYPWPSPTWLAGRPANWLLWAGAYCLYYLSFEGFYRGAVLAALTPRLGAGVANVAQASLATLIHVGKPLAEVAAAFPASLVFGLLVLRFRSLWPAVALHLAIGLLTDAAVVWRGAP